MTVVAPTGSDLAQFLSILPTMANQINADIAAVTSTAQAAPRLPAATDLDTLDSARTDLAYATIDGVTNGPAGEGTGFVRTFYATSTSKVQIWYTVGIALTVYMRFRGSSSWTAWKRIDAQWAIDQAAAYTDAAIAAAGSGGTSAGAVSGSKVVPLALTVGGSPATSALGAVGIRMPIDYAATVTRFRVHLRNINPRFGTVNASSVSLTGVWVGAENTATPGTFTGTVTQISGAVTTAADGSDWVSAWVNVPLLAGTRYLLAYGLNTTGTDSVVGGGYSVASPTDATNNAAATTVRTSMPLDAWIEAETSASTPVIAAWGDSLSSGVGSSVPVHDSVVSQYCRANGALPVHYSASGDSAAQWAVNLTTYKWTRWSSLAKPDVVIAAMGSNDLFGGASVATVQADWTTSVNNIIAKISPNVVITTITPRDGITGTNEDNRRTFNTWLKALPKGRDVFDLVPAVSSDDEALTPALTVDGIHLTTAGYAAEVATITRQLSPAVRVINPALRRIAITDGMGALTERGDTGERDIFTDLVGATGGQASIRRDGNIVSLRIYGVSFASFASAIYTMPLGFRPESDWMNTSFVHTGTSTPSRSTVSRLTGQVLVLGGTTGTATYICTTWPTDDPWPTSLPGTLT